MARDFYDSWKFLENHRIFNKSTLINGTLTRDSHFIAALEILPVKVDPNTKKVSSNPARNTETRIWLEAGPIIVDGDNQVIPTHDYSLDVGGETFEEAIIKLAGKVKKRFGNDTEGSQVTTTLLRKFYAR